MAAYQDHTVGISALASTPLETLGNLESYQYSAKYYRNNDWDRTPCEYTHSCGTLTMDQHNYYHQISQLFFISCPASLARQPFKFSTEMRKLHRRCKGLTVRVVQATSGVLTLVRTRLLQVAKPFSILQHHFSLNHETSQLSILALVPLVFSPGALAYVPQQPPKWVMSCEPLKYRSGHYMS